MTDRATFFEARAIADTRYLRRVLRECRWNAADAAREAGMNRTQFYKLIRRLGIRFPPSASVRKRLGRILKSQYSMTDSEDVRR
jgi:DNA-binding NtrC family response regulator